MFRPSLRLLSLCLCLLLALQGAALALHLLRSQGAHSTASDGTVTSAQQHPRHEAHDQQQRAGDCDSVGLCLAAAQPSLPGPVGLSLAPGPCAMPPISDAPRQVGVCVTPPEPRPRPAA